MCMHIYTKTTENWDLQQHKNASISLLFSTEIFYAFRDMITMLSFQYYQCEDILHHHQLNLTISGI